MNSYKEKLEKQLPIVCGNALGAYLDTNIFMFPAAFKTFRADTHLFAYSYYAIRNRTILAVKKLIEPSGKNKVNVDSIIKIITAPDCPYLSPQDKEGLAHDFKELQQSESALRLKKFRDVIAHDLPDSDNVMIIYNDLMNTVEDVLYILSFVYMAVFKENKMEAACDEMKEIARFLADDYWRAIGLISRQMPKRASKVARLNKLLRGQF